jgi:hypothetical protein
MDLSTFNCMNCYLIEFLPIEQNFFSLKYSVYIL